MAAFMRLGIRLARGTLREVPRRSGQFMQYFRAEMAPPKMSDWPQIQKGFSNLAVGFRDQKWKQVTMREAWLNACITAEIAAWFFVGICIGRGNFIGYVVPHTVPHPDD